MVEVINSGEVLKNMDWAGIVSGVPGISALITIGKTIGIVVLVYLIFLIIRSITQILYSLRFKKLYKNVEEINKKMDVLISKEKKKK